MNTACTCPVRSRYTSSVGTLLSHLVNIQDPQHEKWLEGYCQKNKINYMHLLPNRALGKQDANKPLTDVLKRDFCKD